MGLVHQKVAVAILRDLGHSVTIARNGQEALDAITEEPDRYDLVLMDVLMPELNGLDATCAIRQLEQSRGSHLPIVAMTAQAMGANEVACRRAGMDAFLAKPIRKEKLRRVIESVLSHPGRHQKGKAGAHKPA